MALGAFNQIPRPGRPQLLVHFTFYYPDLTQDHRQRNKVTAVDEIDHELTYQHPDQCLSSSYTIRKALIRKHFLAHCIRAYCTKYPTSILVSACPRTYEFEISFADELDELWTDELWELATKLEEPGSWWILKPSVIHLVASP